jgi:hypothetical protein
MEMEKAQIDARVNQIKAQIATTTSDYDKEKPTRNALLNLQVELQYCM